MDPFLLKFGSLYDLLRDMNTSRNIILSKEQNDIIYKILKAEHKIEDDIDFLYHSGGRKVTISNASSGQQETLPLLVILKALLSKENFLSGGHKTLYIEEPEAHLYPDSQIHIMRLLADVANRKNTQIVITTHSPHILSYLNNLLTTFVVTKDNSAEDLSLSTKKISAYFFAKNQIKDIFSAEDGLILSPEFDQPFVDLSNEYSDLLERMGDEYE